MEFGIICRAENWRVAARLHDENLINRIRIDEEAIPHQATDGAAVFHYEPQYRLLVSTDLVLIPGFGFEMVAQYDKMYWRHRDEIDAIDQRWIFWSVWFRNVGEFAAKNPPEFAAKRADPA